MLNPIKNIFSSFFTSDAQKSLVATLKANIIINMLGSIAYIGLKLFFNFLLLYKMNAEFYGGMGYLFSYIFLLVNLASAPTLYTPSNTIAAHTSKDQAKKILLSLFSVQTLLLIGASLFLWQMLLQNAALTSLVSAAEQIPLFTIAALLVFIEGLRLSLRFLMHMIHQTKIIVPFEIASMLFYMLLVFYFLLTTKTLSLLHVFSFFLLDSIIVTSFFIALLCNWYTQLPNADEQINTFKTTEPFYAKVLIAPSLAHALSYYAGALLSDNMIIVSFMPSLGLSAIALPKMAAYVADSLRIMTKSLIGFSALPLLSLAKSKEYSIQKELFQSTLRYFFILLLYALLAATIGFYISTRTHVSELTYQSLFFISLFFAIKLANQINYFYEKIIIFYQHSSIIILISGFKMIVALFLLYLHPHLSIILFSLLFLQFFTALFYFFYVRFNLLIKE